MDWARESKFEGEEGSEGNAIYQDIFGIRNNRPQGLITQKGTQPTSLGAFLGLLYLKCFRWPDGLMSA